MQKATALPTLMSHHVSPNPGLVTVSPVAFRAQMEALTGAGWHTPGLDEAARFFRGEAVPAKTCVVTFDDGYLDNQVYVAPVRDGNQETPDHRECKRRIAAGDADSVTLRWSEAERLQTSGVFEFHSHTHTHTRWDRTLADPGERQEALANDLLRSRKLLQERLGVLSRHLCWPQGYHDHQYVATAKSLGFDHLYSTESTMNLPNSAVDRIGRFVTKERSGNWLLRRTRLYASPWVGGFYCAVHSAR
jgi:peptidoglycan/xylan/chitin deacetylase (PgdA/CDA1 family)